MLEKRGLTNLELRINQAIEALALLRGNKFSLKIIEEHGMICTISVQPLLLSNKRKDLLFHGFLTRALGFSFSQAFLFFHTMSVSGFSLFVSYFLIATYSKKEIFSIHSLIHTSLMFTLQRKNQLITIYIYT